MSKVALITGITGQDGSYLPREDKKWNIEVIVYPSEFCSASMVVVCLALGRKV